MADINDTIRDNLGLVYQQLIRFNMLNNPDAESFAYEALYKAVITYNPATGNTFSTYAVCVISNSLRHYMRSLNKKRQIIAVSHDAPVNEEEDTTIIDMIVGPDTTEEAIFAAELNSKVHKALRNVYSELTVPSHKKIFEVWYDNDFTARQTELARLTGLSQPYVSRVLSSIKHKLKLELEDYL